MTQSWLRPSAVVTDASGCQVTNEPRATAAAAGGDVDDDDDGGGGGGGRGPCDAAVTRCACVCVTGRSTVTMKAALVVLLVAMAVSAVAGRECDLLARLNVKSQWMRAYSSGHDREHFAEAIWRAYVLAHYSAADRERSIVMTVCVCACLSVRSHAELHV